MKTIEDSEFMNSIFEPKKRLFSDITAAQLFEFQKKLKYH